MLLSRGRTNAREVQKRFKLQGLSCKMDAIRALGPVLERDSSPTSALQAIIGEIKERIQRGDVHTSLIGAELVEAVVAELTRGAASGTAAAAVADDAPDGGGGDAASPMDDDDAPASPSAEAARARRAGADSARETQLLDAFAMGKLAYDATTRQFSVVGAPDPLGAAAVAAASASVWRSGRPSNASPSGRRRVPLGVSAWRTVAVVVRHHARPPTAPPAAAPLVTACRPCRVAAAAASKRRFA